MLLKILACDQGTGMVWLDMVKASLNLMTMAPRTKLYNIDRDLCMENSIA